MTLKIRILHSYTASENVLEAPRDGKFQTLCQSYHRGKGNFFHVMVVDHRGKGIFFHAMVVDHHGKGFFFFSTHQLQRIFFLVSRVEKGQNTSFSLAV